MRCSRGVQRRSMRWLLAIAVCGCAAGPTGGEQPVRPVPPPAEAAKPSAATAIPLPGGANALWWDAAAATLYLTDSNTSAVMTWTDGGGFQLASALPAGRGG